MKIKQTHVYRMVKIPYYRPQRSWGKVMFLHVSVILFTGGCLVRGVPGLGGSAWGVSGPRGVAGSWGCLVWEDVCLGGAWSKGSVWPGGCLVLGGCLVRGVSGPGEVSAPGGWYPSMQTPPRSSACWEIRATSKWYASYWNAFLLSLTSLWPKILDNLYHKQ